MIPEAQWVYDVAWFLNQIAQPVAILGAVTFWIIGEIRKWKSPPRK